MKVCEELQRSKTLHALSDQVNKHIREHLKYAHLRLGGKGNTGKADE